MNSKLLHKKDPKALIRAFIGGSLVVVTLCLSVTAAIFTLVFVTKENHRVDVAKQQVLQFFQNQHSVIAEEMWTRNLEAVAMRVAGITAQLGNGEYDLYLADEAGACLLYSKGQLSSNTCATPQELANFAREHQAPTEASPILRYDERTERNIYMVPVFVGSILKGYLYVSITDPYHFYRGNSWSLIFESFFPAICFILLVLIAWFYVCNRLFLKPYLASLVELQREQAMVHAAQQVAHDLKSPIATLLQVIATLKQIPEDRIRIIRNALNTIRDIANTLIDKKCSKANDSNQVAAPASDHGETVHLLSGLIDVAVAERRMEYRSKAGVEICSQPSTESYGLFAKVQATEFKRMLSNLINNAVEAVGEQGQIFINSVRKKNRIVISIADNGRGIPQERLASLGIRGVTFDKPNGRGLGLYHASETAKSWGGDLKIESTLGKGTTIKVTLPNAEAPKWFAPDLTVSEETTVVILDDDNSIHQAWAAKFESLGAQKKSFNFLRFSHAEDVLNWHRTNDVVKNTLYLCDYQLNHQAKNGLDVIEELGIAGQSILVTGHFEEMAIRERCVNLGVKLVPKEFIGFLPIRIGVL